MGENLANQMQARAYPGGAGRENYIFIYTHVIFMSTEEKHAEHAVQ
jgi:hypothetical protein